jgi:hypothetical protein
VKNVGKPCDREGHARIDGGRLETGHLTTDPEKNGLAGNHRTINGSETYRRTTLPRQSPTLHGEFNRFEMYSLLQRINTYLKRWARKKFKRLRTYRRFKAWWQGLVTREPEMFAHWAWMRAFSWIG